ncbi:hypothetical protein [Megamonas hypermegale]|uniref:hypothetical protein n=1 Tax=Megamonas hypermegale TaxID=158847 RepID=UPI0025A382B5|nr:hypothetical protein [Megamonas hypermegale]MDM8143172.1 hypothetical protein [Megamonas hypermegale]
MSTKIGRPKAENPKSFDLKVRIDEDTNTKLTKYAEENNITKAEAVRRGIYILLEKNK